MYHQLSSLQVTHLASLVRDGAVRATEVIDAHLDRIASTNPRVNAITEVFAAAAREAAAQVDCRRASGEPLGPLAGVPFTVKANLDVAGSATTHGIPRFRHLIASADALPVERLRKADAIPIGHANMPDLALRGMHTRSQLYGDTRNPWDATRTPGGSSGGDGAAVATGMAALGLGNDSGGSIRIPATFCGVAGLVPSYGRFAADRRLGPRDPSLAAQLFPVDGPLARSVADLRLAFEVLAGPDPRDPRAVPAPLLGPPLPPPIHVAVVVDPGGLGVHPTVRQAVQTGAAALREAGYVVDEIEDVPHLAECLDAYGRMLMTEFSLTWPSIRSLLTEEGRRYIELSMAARPPVRLAEYVQLPATRLSLQRDWLVFLTQHPLVLAPVFTEPAVAPGLESRDPDSHARVATAMRLCSVTSFLGLPAVAVPTGVADGLPQGIQLIGAPYREDLCLEAAAAIEQRLGTLTPIDPGPWSCRAMAMPGHGDDHPDSPAAFEPAATLVPAPLGAYRHVVSAV
jgi:amidase